MSLSTTNAKPLTDDQKSAALLWLMMVIPIEIQYMIVDYLGISTAAVSKAHANAAVEAKRDLIVFWPTKFMVDIEKRISDGNVVVNLEFQDEYNFCFELYTNRLEKSQSIKPFDV